MYILDHCIFQNSISYIIIYPSCFATPATVPYHGGLLQKFANQGWKGRKP